MNAHPISLLKTAHWQCWTLRVSKEYSISLSLSLHVNYIHFTFHTSRCLNQTQYPIGCSSHLFCNFKNIYSIQTGQKQLCSLTKWLNVNSNVILYLEVREFHSLYIHIYLFCIMVSSVFYIATCPHWKGIMFAFKLREDLPVKNNLHSPELEPLSDSFFGRMGLSLMQGIHSAYSKPS